MKCRRVYEDPAGYAGVGYVRIHTMVEHFPITIDREFDEHDGLNTRYILLFDEKLPVATCRLHLGEVAKIERVSVLPDYQHQGLGSQLLKEAEMWLKELGYHHIVITSRDTAVAFYEKNGYVRMDREPMGSGLFVCIYVEKELGE
ncbi:MAG: GNAT family N-acetyltransferase [Intestinibaculum porci]|uniref:GNAT family N-acetyltransferase n=1 Tax=Intestinibaculum porci TaxID=2487118 RepID=UPI003F018C25